MSTLILVVLLLQQMVLQYADVASLAFWSVLGIAGGMFQAMRG